MGQHLPGNVRLQHRGRHDKATAPQHAKSDDRSSAADCTPCNNYVAWRLREDFDVWELGAGRTAGPIAERLEAGRPAHLSAQRKGMGPPRRTLRARLR
ncbi:hypothetical protein V1290_006598 [Bradyrhizobium sp. AZCC 1578]